MDWRKNIQKYLDQCVLAKGTLVYPLKVKQLVSGVSATYPNWNANRIIKQFIKGLDKKYTILINKKIDANPEEWFHPGKRQLNEPDLINDYYDEIFEFIKNLVASKRMLLYGVKRIHGGTQMKDYESDEDIE
jgi:hypothetical protein